MKNDGASASGESLPPVRGIVDVCWSKTKRPAWRSDTEGAFATLARRPGCARGLQVAMFVVDGPQASLASQSNTRPLRLALWKRPKPSFLWSQARGGARRRFWAAAGWLARALAGRGNVFARVPALRSRSGRRARSEMAAISPAFIYGFPLSTLSFFHSVLALPPPS